jgi:quercetin dioxygenase-like cupin family protein
MRSLRYEVAGAHPVRPIRPGKPLDIADTMAALGVGITHHFGGGVYAKETRIPAGRMLGQHAHRFDHLSILASGRVRVTVDGESREVEGPACLVIAAGKVHEVLSLTDAVWYCIHATNCTEADEVDAELIA